MSEPDPRADECCRVGQAVFISYSTEDRQDALGICEAIERHGIECWMAGRDVEPGRNYQEAIVRAIRQARALVLVFSGAANNSDEIKKELSLASRFRVPVLALKIDEVEPSDAFAYELSTRQWIDAVDGWARSIGLLTAELKQIQDSETPSATRPRRSAQRAPILSRRLIMIGTALGFLLMALAAGLLLRPSGGPAHSMEVRLTGFTQLSTDIPETLSSAVLEEMAAAFGNDGIVRVSTAAARQPGPGSTPAYALGGTLRRDGANIRVIASLVNEQSGSTLWTYSYSYDATQMERVPRWVAVEAGRVVRCGLFAASTYRKSLPDAVMSDYMQYCQNTDGTNPERGKALLFARKVVAAVPDFSWGWSAVEIASRWVYWEKFGTSEGRQLRAQALQAADKAISLDPTNSQALSEKVFLIPWEPIKQEQLLKQALSARPLDCACEHFIYAIVLQNVGRYTDSINELRRSADALALNPDPRIGLADALLVVGRPEEAKSHLNAAAELVPDAAFLSQFTVSETTTAGDYRAGIDALNDPKLKLPTTLRTALEAGFQAMVIGDDGAKNRAVRLLVALPVDQGGFVVAKLLGSLGATREALEVIEAAAANGRFEAPSWLFYPEMRQTLDDPYFGVLAQRFGLMNYWRKTGKRPDFCLAKNRPQICKAI